MAAVGALLGATVAAALVALAVTGLAAARAGMDGRHALLGAEQALQTRDLPRATGQLTEAGRQFDRARGQMRRLGLLLPLMRTVPLLRDQVSGVETLAQTGTLLVRAGRSLIDAGAILDQTTHRGVSIADSLESLRRAEDTMAAGMKDLDAARSRLATLERASLVGPMERVRRQVGIELPLIRSRAASLHDGLNAFLAFLGGSGPRRYLVFSQNPDELRPTGGFIGTYGVLKTDGGRTALERYEAIESWYVPRPDAVVAPEVAPRALRLSSPPVRQTIANVNTTPDWPQAAKLATELWAAGGEEPVDGVVGITPEFLARVLAVLGPVTLPGYGDIITADNLIARLDFYTHPIRADENDPDRKRFVAVLAQAVLQRLVSAPPSTWAPLASTLGQAFDLQEAMAWSSEPAVSDVLAARHWDGTLPRAAGDFFYDAEFEYAAKNGRGLRRTFEHEVELRPDGSAHIVTTITMENTQPARNGSDVGAQSYMTLYGPEGATLDSESDPPFASEASLVGHPAAGWLRSAPPLAQTTLRVVWDAPMVAEQRPDGKWEYRLWWVHIPAHVGDVLELRVDLPKGWQWVTAPPSRHELTRDVKGAWLISAPAG